MAFIVMKAADEFKTRRRHPTSSGRPISPISRSSAGVYLSSVLEDFSRYIIAWKLCTTMKAEDVTATLELTLKASGLDKATVVHRPRLLPDNGSSYISTDLANSSTPFPPLFEGFHGDDEINLAIAGKKIDAVEFLLIAGHHSDFLARNSLLLQQVLQQDFLGDFTSFFLGLKQDDRANVVGVLGGKIVQTLARQNAVAHGVFPAFMLAQADGEFNHLLRLEFRGGDIVQHVAVIPRWLVPNPLLTDVNEAPSLECDA